MSAVKASRVITLWEQDNSTKFVDVPADKQFYKQSKDLRVNVT